MKRARIHLGTDHRVPAGDCRDSEGQEIARKHGVSEGTIYVWKAKFGGVSVPEAQRLKSLEGENRRLDAPLAKAMLKQGFA